MTVIEKAYAKINLYLDVTGCRDDGFHDILSIMHSVDLCDIVTLSCVESDKTEIVITTNDPSLPTDERNIVFRAVSEYLSYFNIKARVDIHLDKKIPIGAGLGGGSSDASATLRALNKVYRKADLDQLLELATGLGSDVPFCLVGGLSVCVGRGEMFTSLPKREPMTFVIAIGESRVSTPKAYAALDKLYNNFTVGLSRETFAYNQRIIDMLSGGDFDVPSYNIFEQVINFEEINTIKEIMTKSRAEYTLMSGSGPAVVGCFANLKEAEEARQALASNDFTAFTCRSVYPEVEI